MAQPVFTDTATWVHHELWVESDFDTDGDGQRDRMHVDVSRPGETDSHGLRVPVVYESSPYYAGTAPTPGSYWFYTVDHEVGADPPPRLPAPPISARNTSPAISTSHESTWVPRGFAVVHSESPGTGLSDGCPTVGGANESLAPKAVVDWLNGRAKGYTTRDGDVEVAAYWSTGKVGMTGTSYNGTLPLAAATTGVEGLEAIIPVAPNTSYYEYYRSNGLVRAPGGWQGEDIDVLFDYINSGLSRDYCAATVRAEMEALHDRRTGDFNAFWASRDYLPATANVEAATLMAHAFGDWNVKPSHSVRIYEALKAQGTPAQIYMHQGGHGGAPPHEMMNRWFTRYLYGVDNDVEAQPRAWIVREGAPASNPTAYGDYPNPASAQVTFNLQAGGAAAGGLTFLAQPASAAETLTDNALLTASQLSTQANSLFRLVYRTPPLGAPLHLSGTPSVTVRLASSKAAANLSVQLVAFTASGAATVVTRGWADPQNHQSPSAGQPLVPGQFVTVRFALEPDDQVIPAGSQLGLMIFSSDRDYTVRPVPGTQLTVDLAATSLRLPVVGGRFAAAICTAADPRPTVVIGTIDSGVPNRTLAGACTINHHILDDVSWPSRAAFLDHVGEVAGLLRDQGTVSAEERDALVGAAEASGIGG